MESIGSFVNIKSHNFHFHGCSTCEGHCCNGAKGFAASPLILEDFEEVYKNFPILFSVTEQKLMAYVLLNDGKNYCRYYVNQQCSIYLQRPPACKLYPVSPYFEQLFIDTACPSVNQDSGYSLCHDGQLNSAFATKRLENFVEKLEETHAFFESINALEDFEHVGNLSGIPLFRYIKPSDNKYIKMHLESLKHSWFYVLTNSSKPELAVS
ncbi:YkgJ family cysteine cluster protein [Sulfurospirillum oryzae]|uniref:YkgJ family cysteine cluster protein n=1 Tax=Sulfurospirillum oryzae TaxID=2976535 RepID=UPI0021E796EC|nr:YkgJ family cysteine cluster protein [Sulfurospirillum oryzae]